LPFGWREILLLIVLPLGLCVVAGLGVAALQHRLKWAGLRWVGVIVGVAAALGALVYFSPVALSAGNSSRDLLVVLLVAPLAGISAALFPDIVAAPLVVVGGIAIYFFAGHRLAAGAPVDTAARGIIIAAACVRYPLIVFGQRFLRQASSAIVDSVQLWLGAMCAIPVLLAGDWIVVGLIAMLVPAAIGGLSPGLIWRRPQRQKSLIAVALTLDITLLSFGVIWGDVSAARVTWILAAPLALLIVPLGLRVLSSRQMTAPEIDPARPASPRWRVAIVWTVAILATIALCLPAVIPAARELNRLRQSEMNGGDGQ
jgi:hypothetical protein